MKTVRRIVKIECKDCGGNGYRHDNSGARVRCAPCKGTGEVERVVNEIVHDDEVVKDR